MPLTPAQRAGQTRSARTRFMNAYPETADLVRCIAEGWTNDEIVDEFDVHVSSVAAVKANLTRGVYAPFVEVTADNEFAGSCNF